MNMPSKQWMKDRRQVTFWLSKEEKRDFLAACEAEDKKPTNVLRDTVLIMIAKNGGPDGAA